MAKARGLALLGALVLAGCGGSSAPKPSNVTLHLALPIVPRQLDPAKASDLPSLNVAHELYSGLTRYSGAGVRPDLAQSWDVGQGGLVWTFHLRKGLRWSDDSPIVAGDFRRAWLHALDPKTGAPYAGPYLGIVRGARRFHATGTGDIGVQALDDRTLRVTLQHPVPWFDELVAHPVTAPEPPRRSAFSGPFRLVSRSGGRLVLERNFNYWDAKAVKPSRLVLSASTHGADVVLPRGLAGSGLPWVQTAGPPPPGARQLPTMATGLMWLATRTPQLADVRARLVVAGAVSNLGLGRRQVPLIAPAVPGAAQVNPRVPVVVEPLPNPLKLTLVWAREDLGGSRVAARLRANDRQLRRQGVELDYRPVQTLSELLSTPADLTLLGWSPKIFDAYNLLDLFPCGSAFNVARWCDPAFDAGMRRAVRTLDDRERWAIEHRLAERLHQAAPAFPVYTGRDWYSVKSGVTGFSWSPIGFYELMGMTRS
jgi:ABC-type oligopeptide transport system substrate-binding subunit